MGVIGETRKDPVWQGANSAAGGWPPALSAAETGRLKQLIHEEVGVAKVTIRYCRKRLPFLKKVSAECAPHPAPPRPGLAPAANQGSSPRVA